MPIPAIKRRKLSHDGDSDSEGSLAWGNADGTNVDNGSAAEGSEEDVSMNESEELESQDDDASDDDEEEDTEEMDNKASEKNANTSSSKPTLDKAKKMHKKPDAPMQDGGYTAETFKSNIFKLQVDELLDQVKLRYGKKEAPAENAMRTLKTLIEQLPNRAPLSVG